MYSATFSAIGSNFLFYLCGFKTKLALCAYNTANLIEYCHRLRSSISHRTKSITYVFKWARSWFCV